MQMECQLTLQILGSIECLLLLKEEGIAHERQSTNSLAVSSVPRLSVPLSLLIANASSL